QRHHRDLDVVDPAHRLDAIRDLVDRRRVDLAEGKVLTLQRAPTDDLDLLVMELSAGVDEAGRLLAGSELEVGAALRDLDLERARVVAGLVDDGVVRLLETGAGEQLLVPVRRRTTAAPSAGGERHGRTRERDRQSPLGELQVISSSSS